MKERKLDELDEIDSKSELVHVLRICARRFNIFSEINANVLLYTDIIRTLIKNFERIARVATQGSAFLMHRTVLHSKKLVASVTGDRKAPSWHDFWNTAEMSAGCRFARLRIGDQSLEGGFGSFFESRNHSDIVYRRNENKRISPTFFWFISSDKSEGLRDTDGNKFILRPW